MRCGTQVGGTKFDEMHCETQLYFYCTAYIKVIMKAKFFSLKFSFDEGTPKRPDKKVKLKSQTEIFAKEQF